MRSVLKLSRALFGTINKLPRNVVWGNLKTKIVNQYIFD